MSLEMERHVEPYLDARAAADFLRLGHKTIRTKRKAELLPGSVDLDTVAGMLGITRGVVRSLTHQGKLPGFKISRTWQFRLSVIEDWISAGMRGDSGWQAALLKEFFPTEHDELQRLDLRASEYDATTPQASPHGCTGNQYKAMYLSQRGICAICGIHEESLQVDHCHRTGKIRALLCGPCNRGIGHLKDSAATALSAATYLETHGAL